MSVIGGPAILRPHLLGSGFRRLLAVRLASQVADGWFQAALAGSLLFNPERQSTPVAIAAGFAILLLPYSVVGPFVGVLLDRWQRRTSLYLANLLRAALVVPTVVLLWTGHPGIGFGCLVLLAIAANRFFLAGLSAALPHVVDRARLVTANAVATTLGTACYTAGLASAVALLGTPMIAIDDHGYAVIALLGAGGFVVSALLVRVLFDAPALGPDRLDRSRGPVLLALASVVAGLRDGLRHLAQRSGAGAAVLVQAGHRALFGVLAMAVLLLFSRYFASDDNARSISGLGMVVIAGGLGALVAAVLTPIATRRMPGWAWISVMLGTAGITLLALGPPFLAPLLLLAVFLVNIASQGTKIVVDATVQRECDDAFLGRVFSVNDTAFNATFVTGLFLAALFLPANGRSVSAVVVVAIGYGVLALTYAARSRPARGLPTKPVTPGSSAP